MIFNSWNYDIRLVMKSLGFVLFVLVGQGHDEGEGSFKMKGEGVCRWKNDLADRKAKTVLTHWAMES